MLAVSRSYAESACGSISTETPEAAEGQTMKIHFVPISISNKPKKLLLTNSLYPRKVLFDRNLKDTDGKEKQQQAQETTHGLNVSYTITSINESQAGRYFVLCDNNAFSNQLKIDVITTAEPLQNVDAASCGNLTIVRNDIAVGSKIQLLFYANRAMPSMEWFHFHEREYYRLDKQERNKYEETGGGLKFGFKITRSTVNDAGLYKAHCGDQVYSNEVRVNVVVKPPERPDLSPLKDFPHCTRCVEAKPGTTVKVKCNSSGGSPPQHVTIYKDSQEEKNFTFQVPDAELAYSFTASEDFEWSTITCNISNDAATTPLSTSATVYLYRRPSGPFFSDPTAKEGIQSQISCSTQNGRPKPNIKFIFNKTFANFTNIEKYHTDNKTYSVESVFTKTLTRKDDDMPLECCIEHDTIDGKLDCEKLKLNVNYAPNTSQLKEIAREALPNGLTNISLICNSGVSNPASNITWTGLKNIQRKFLDLDERPGRRGGYQVSQHITITVGRENFGKTIKCGITNPVFPDLSLFKESLVNITYPPYVKIQEGTELKVGVGQNVSVLCSVESNPTSNVSWSSEDGTKNITQDSPSEQEHILYIHSAQTTDSGMYICSARNDRGMVQRNISVIVNDTMVPEKDTLLSEPFDVTGTIAGMISVLVAVCVLVVIAIVISKWRKRRGAAKPQEVVPQNHEDGHRLNDQGEDHAHNNRIEEQAEPAEYAVVIPKAQRQKNTEKQQSGKEANKELVYAELDLEPSDSTRVVRKPETEQIEYVELDFKNKPPPSQNDEN